MTESEQFKRKGASIKAAESNSVDMPSCSLKRKHLRLEQPYLNLESYSVNAVDVLMN